MKQQQDTELETHEDCSPAAANSHDQQSLQFGTSSCTSPKTYCIDEMGTPWFVLLKRCRASPFPHIVPDRANPTCAWKDVGSGRMWKKCDGEGIVAQGSWGRDVKEQRELWWLGKGE